MGLFDKLKENKRMKEQQRLEFEKNNVVAFMCNHLKDKNIEIKNANCDSRGRWRFTCKECGESLNYNNVILVSLSDVINLHPDDMQNLTKIQNKNINFELTEEMEDNIINTNINRNNDLRSDITGIKIRM